VAAAQRYDGLQNRLYLDALYRGRYPADILELCAGDLPEAQPGDHQLIATPTDFLGINLYRRSVIGAGSRLPPIGYRRVNPPGEYTAMGWEVSPSALYDTLLDVHTRYAPLALYVTENGAAFPDTLDADGHVHDERRVAYLHHHIDQSRRAIADGVPLRGYFAWSLLDNFEWAWGYERRFGIVYVDFPTQRRIIKDSGHAYAALIRQATGTG
jgi:beta-glucosidase